MSSETDTERTVLDLFAGLGGWSHAFKGHPRYDVTTVDIAESFDRKLWLDDYGISTLTVESHIRQDIVEDLRELTFRDLGTDWDIVLASPVCKGFTMGKVGDNWTDGYPVTETARDSVELLFKAFELVLNIAPEYYAIENPVGMAGDYLKTVADTVDIVTQCQYAHEDDDYPPQKRTYIAHNIPAFQPKRCSRGDDCHVPAPRGSDSGTQANNVSSADRAAIPAGLSRDIRDAIEDSYARRTTQQTLNTVVSA